MTNISETSAGSAGVAVESFDVRNRWTNRVQFTAEIVCKPDASIGVKLGLAIEWARKTDAILTDANLRGADFTGAILTDANLRGADFTDADFTRAVLTGADFTRAILTGAILTDAILRGADLTDADFTRAILTGADFTRAVLTDANLRVFKADMWMTLLKNRNEVAGLIAALKEGRVDGSQYSGDCACLVGTIANVASVDYSVLEHNSNNPAERWFMMIKKGDKPGDDTGGGFAAARALEWAEEFQALMATTPTGDPQ